MKKIIFGLFILTAFISCSRTDKKENIVNIASSIDKSEGFIDIPLSITGKTETDSSYVYTAEGIYQTDTVGLQISLKKGAKAGIVDDNMDNVFLRNGIVLQSIGEKSDKLISLMANLYDVDSIASVMRKDPMILTCANLNQTDVNYSTGEYKFKVFMESEEDYAELFINFDFTGNRIYLNEKDNEYRQGILHYWMMK